MPWLLLVWITVCPTAHAETELVRSGAHWSVERIMVDGHGPFRFLLDTGAESTVLDPAVAERIGLRPTYRVEVVSVNGIRLVPATAQAGLTVDGSPVKAEILFDSLETARRADPSIVGILGQSALVGLAYELDFAQGRFRVGAEPMPGGLRLHYGQSHSRPCLQLRNLRLILDSGVGAVILFRSTYPGVRRTEWVEVTTNGGEKKIAQAGVLDRWDLGEIQLRDVPVVLHPNKREDADGLLPLGLFSRVHIDPNGLITLQL